ncbi:hypothetical protein KAU33_01990, partial [Candidatus Dependentiae bacterium]|nr:hypothetical protein [Candidatus Dependentiae bacterium]
MKITKKFIIYLIVFSLLPIIVLGLISIYFSRDVNLREFRNNSDLILVELSNEIQEYINHNKNILTSITISMLESKNLESELQKEQALLRRYIFDYDTFLELYIFDENLKPLTSSNEDFTHSEKLIEELRKFGSQDKYIPEIYFTEEGLPFYYDFEYGFLSNGEKYIVGGKISLISIWTYLHTKKIGKEGLVFLLDKDNTLIAHPKIQKVFQQEKFPGELTDSNYFYYRNFDNIKCIGISRRIHSNHIRLVLERPANEVFTTSRRITLFLIIITLILIILITFISSRIGLIIVNNINNLLGGMKTISSGDLQFRIESKGEEEFREIADGINKMTDEILEMQDELAEKRQLAEIGTLTSKIAHDLRNPLTPIKTFS